MALDKYLAYAQDLESATADQRRQIKELCSSGMALEKEAFELKKIALNVTQQLDAACLMNTRLEEQKLQLCAVLLAAAGMPPSAAAAVASAAAAFTGQELEVRLRSIVRAPRASLAMVGVGEAARAVGIATEKPQAEQVAEDDEVKVKPWPAGTQAAQEQGSTLNTNAHGDLKQPVFPATQHGSAPQRPAAAPQRPAAAHWQGPITKAVADLGQAALRGVPKLQEAACSQGPQVDSHRVFAGWEHAASRLSQEAHVQRGLAVQAQPQQRGCEAREPGAFPEAFLGLQAGAASRLATAQVAAVQRKPPPLPEAVAVPPQKSRAEELLGAINVMAAAQERRNLLGGSVMGWPVAGAVVAKSAAVPPAAQQDAPPQPECALLPPGPVAPRQVAMARPTAPSAGERLDERMGSWQRRLRSLGAGTTTLTIRNVPGRYTQDRLIEEWGPEYSYDFLYLPHSLRDQRSKGYAFVNFTTHEAALGSGGVGKGSTSPCAAARGLSTSSRLQSKAIGLICGACGTALPMGAILTRSCQPPSAEHHALTLAPSCGNCCPQRRACGKRPPQTFSDVRRRMSSLGLQHLAHSKLF
eukprot:CAMPEP_0179110982 /NCGR_PEP_ID=MMETSP0796-20121207/51819_1 /TAXON_ID=73915 /ORGANISM="Pyrodinium bahamense, Strain pbaha01" /LENGTH=582 /DNA_ID=CAMNT_0020809127 /DNA_START=30 /DNA_END=1776 /DNA_ORIENTATION=-